MYFLHNELFTFYKDIMKILDLKTLRSSDSLNFYNTNLKNDSRVTCDGKQIVLTSDIHESENHKKRLTIEFNPLNEQNESCSRLIIEDSIHFYLRNLIHNLFNKAITIKDGTYLFEQYFFDKTQLDKLENPTKNTKFKFYNLFNIVTATSFSKNLISFFINPTDSSNHIKVDFKYPLYEALCTLQNNTIYGIYLEDSEIKLFTQIYKNFIIDQIDELFKDSIKIPDNSSNYPQFYVLIEIRLMLEETFWKEYNITYIGSCKKYLLKYFQMLSNLNNLTYMISFSTKHQQELDQKSYKNELEIRKESEPNWLILKDNSMPKTFGIQEFEVVNDKNEKIKNLEKSLESAQNKYIRQVNNFLANERVNDFIQNYQQMINNQEWSEIFYWQNLVLAILNENSASLWFDTRIDKYCFRSKVGGNIVYENREGISELLTRALKERIDLFLNRYRTGFFANHAIEIILVHKLNGIHNQKLKSSEKASNVIKILLFENAIPAIDDDRFDIESSKEFSKHDNDFFYTRNRFIPTVHLSKRLNGNYHIGNNAIKYGTFFKLSENGYLLEALEQTANCKRSSFIEDFIFYLVNEDINSYYYVMNWLACYFKCLRKSGTALVLLGDQEVTQNIFWNKIIKEIFGQQYCVTINDRECSSKSTFDIAKDKLFFHIGDITDAATKFDDETLYKLVKDFLNKASLTGLNKNDEQEEVVIHGQMIITAKNPSPYIKRAMSKCTIINVSDMDSINEKLNVPDELILENKIQEDLDNFTNILQSFEGNQEHTKYAMDTKDRKSISNDKSFNIDKEDIDQKINDFIQAIKAKDIDYFEKLRELEDGSIYEHLKNAFELDDGYFIGQDILHYYNALHEHKSQNKRQLMERLKEKNSMFSQEVKTLKILTSEKKEEVLFQAYKTTKDTGNKELYKINGYKMAKDITVPYGAIIISSQDNIRKYNHPDLDNAIKIHKEHKEQQGK